MYGREHRGDWIIIDTTPTKYNFPRLVAIVGSIMILIIISYMVGYNTGSNTYYNCIINTAGDNNPTEEQILICKYKTRI